MRKTGLFALILLGSVATASTGDDQAYFAILAETKIMRIAGMKPMPAIKLPPGIKLPGGISLPGQPSRSLNVRLWSPSIAPDSATASLAIPNGLKMGDKLDLELYRPTASEGSAAGGGGGGHSQPHDFTIMFYWGSSATVKPDQPKVIHFGDLDPSQAQNMSQRAAENPMRPGASNYFYKAGWTTGHWPTSSDPGAVDPEASLQGHFALSTNYTGNVAIDVPSNVDFMAPIDLQSPDLSQKPSLEAALDLKWGAIPNALGSNASIIGMVGENTMIIWSSSEVYSMRLFADMSYLQMQDVRDRVAAKEFMPGDQTESIVPAGIFKDADFVMMNMIAYGPGTALDNSQPIPRVQTKSTLMAMLGGKKAHTGGPGDR